MRESPALPRRRVGATRASTTAAWKEAATSARPWIASGGGVGRGSVLAAQVVEHRGLEAAEGEIGLAPARPVAREADLGGIARSASFEIDGPPG
jgi:hypothetical protein